MGSRLRLLTQGVVMRILLEARAAMLLLLAEEVAAVILPIEGMQLAVILPMQGMLRLTQSVAIVLLMEEGVEARRTVTAGAAPLLSLEWQFQALHNRKEKRQPLLPL